ncbi:uncharacterized protein C7orf78 homolog [Rhinophrynus dorsalis]
MYTNSKSFSENGQFFLFARQTRFNADGNLAVERSESFMKPKYVREVDIWRKPPPDFSVRLYRSLSLPRKSIKFVEEKEEIRNKNHIHKLKQAIDLKKIENNHFPILVKKEEPPKFQTRFKPVGPFESSIIYVKNGVYPKEKYQDPNPHDFRQYETGIPDFLTSYPRDPFNLKFKLQHLNFVCGHQPLEEKKTTTKGFISHQPAAPTWDSSLILPKSPWPPKSASFTRHRRRRGVYSAFMDRVEEKFINNMKETFQ